MFKRICALLSGLAISSISVPAVAGTYYIGDVNGFKDVYLRYGEMSRRGNFAFSAYYNQDFVLFIKIDCVNNKSTRMLLVTENEFGQEVREQLPEKWESIDQEMTNLHCASH
ncbi:MAG: hypothetical protein AAGF26_09765 [Cyanobacteria bacterium P01_G01_bin.49]